ncbi:MAG: hypothetical protein U0470_04520 [Anaerolineae bacterium]
MATCSIPADRTDVGFAHRVESGDVEVIVAYDVQSMPCRIDDHRTQRIRDVGHRDVVVLVGGAVDDANALGEAMAGVQLVGGLVDRHAADVALGRHVDQGAARHVADVEHAELHRIVDR